MVLYELAILKNGMIVFEKNFYKRNDLNKVSNYAKAQFLDAIFHVIKVASSNENDMMNTLDYEQFCICFHHIEKKIDGLVTPISYLIYTIGDNRIKKDFSRLLLERILVLYLDKYEKSANQIYAEKIDVSGEFGDLVNQIIGDFFQKKVDRMTDLFF